MIPYGRHLIDDTDIDAVTDALNSDWLTTGPRITKFEWAFAAYCGAKEAVAVNSGTAALHCAMRALRIGPGDEVIVPAITFAATANAVLYCGARPMFADVEPDTLLIDPASVERLITDRTAAIVGMDYAGQPADYDALRVHNLPLIADACHSPGATYTGRRTGTLAHLNCFSFHPVKHITTCEGGMLTGDLDYVDRARTFRNHGIANGNMLELGYNYRLNDVQAALGLSQLRKLDHWVAKRQEIAGWYDALFADTKVKPLRTHADRTNAYHLYVVRVPNRDLARGRLERAGIGTQVHYKPVYLHSYYRDLGYRPGLCPVAEAAYTDILSLPMFPSLTRADVERIASYLCV